VYILVICVSILVKCMSVLVICVHLGEMFVYLGEMRVYLGEMCVCLGEMFILVKCVYIGDMCVYLGEMCVLSLIHSYVAICRLCALRDLIIICFSLSFSNYSTFFNILFILISCFVCLFSMLFILCFCIFLSIVSPSYIFLYLYKLNDHCHRAETQLQQINILSYIISGQSAHEGGKVVNPTHRPPLPPKIFLVLISVRGSIHPRP
jgi:hypothetical protein